MEPCCCSNHGVRVLEVGWRGIFSHVCLTLHACFELVLWEMTNCSLHHSEWARCTPECQKYVNLCVFCLLHVCCLSVTGNVLRNVVCFHNDPKNTWLQFRILCYVYVLFIVILEKELLHHCVSFFMRVGGSSFGSCVNCYHKECRHGRINRLFPCSTWWRW